MTSDTNPDVHPVTETLFERAGGPGAAFECDWLRFEKADGADWRDGIWEIYTKDGVRLTKINTTAYQKVEQLQCDLEEIAAEHTQYELEK